MERRLRALLYRRGLDHATAEDIVQEVALRALAGRVTFTSARDLLRWAGPVACNLHVDLLRQRARLHDGDVGPDHPATNDVAGEVADRMELQRAFRGIAALRPADRAAIIEAVADEPAPTRNRKEAVRLAVRRHRARSRLALVLEQLAGWTVGWQLARRSRGAVAVAVVPLAALPLVIGSWGGAPGGPAHGGTQSVVPVTRPVPVRDVLHATPPRPAPRPAAPPAAVPAAARPRRAPQAQPTPDVAVAGPNGVSVTATGSDRRPDDPVVLCVRDVPALPEVCL